MNIDVLLKEIEVLKWQVQILKNNIEVKSSFDSLVFELDLTKEEHDQIIDLFISYTNKFDNNFNRHTVENEMANISPVFGTNTQVVELLLKELATEQDDEPLKKLFKKIYGHMKKFEGVFEEVEV